MEKEYWNGGVGLSYTTRRAKWITRQMDKAQVSGAARGRPYLWASIPNPC